MVTNLEWVISKASTFYMISVIWILYIQHVLINYFYNKTNSQHFIIIKALLKPFLWKLTPPNGKQFFWSWECKKYRDISKVLSGIGQENALGSNGVLIMLNLESDGYTIQDTLGKKKFFHAINCIVIIIKTTKKYVHKIYLCSGRDLQSTYIF